MDITIRCDEVKVISEGEIGRIKLTIIGAFEEDIVNAMAEIERQKYNELHKFSDISEF